MLSRSRGSRSPDLVLAGGSNFDAIHLSGPFAGSVDPDLIGTTIPGADDLLPVGDVTGDGAPDLLASDLLAMPPYADSLWLLRGL